MSKQQTRIGIIGCGAVTERCHLPALAKIRGVQTSVLVDQNRARAEKLARQYNVPHVAEDSAYVRDKVDAAIIALPHYLHAPVSIDLLRHGIDILVEKPMALSEAECDAMNRAAEQGQAILAVGLMRRFRHGSQWVKAALDAEVIGPIESFDFREGHALDWPVASDFLFRRETAGGGVLIDIGAHAIDLLLWWLGGVESFEYYDDSYGGVEADCELHLTFATGAQGIVELSRSRKLRNTAIIRGQRGEIELSLHSNRLIASPKDILGYRAGGMDGRHLPKQSFEELFVPEIKDWLHSIDVQQASLVSGSEASRSIALIEACYEQRQLLEYPWVKPERLSTKRLQDFEIG